MPRVLRATMFFLGVFELISAAEWLQRGGQQRASQFFPKDIMNNSDWVHLWCLYLVTLACIRIAYGITQGKPSRDSFHTCS